MKAIQLLLLALLLAAPTSRAADIKISQLSLGSAGSSASGDSFPYVSAAANITKRLTVWDLVNVPTLVSTYAPKVSPIFTGTLTAPIITSSTSITSPSFVGTLTGNADTATSLSGVLNVLHGGTGLSSTVANQLLYSSATSTIAGLATVNSGALVTSASGVPSIVSGAVASRVLRTNGTSVSFAQVAAATDVSGQLPIVNGGTGQATAATAINALLPSQTGNAGNTLSTDGTNVSWGGLPSGIMLPFGGVTAPVGWLLADGTAVSRTTYAALFAVMGTTYGVGDGSTTFNLPNTKGVFIRGAGSQTISSITYSATRGTSQGDQMQGHFHTTTGGANLALVGYNGGAGSVIPQGSGSSANGSYMNFGNNYSYAIGVTGPLTDGTNGTPRTGAETRPANISATYIIKY